MSRTNAPMPAEGRGDHRRDERYQDPRAICASTSTVEKMSASQTELSILKEMVIGSLCFAIIPAFERPFRNQSEYCSAC